MLNKIKHFLDKYYLILLGFLVISLYFWNRFLRIREAKELPFDLTVVRFYIYIYICCIFSYIIFTLIFSPKKNKVIEEILDWIFIPIKELEKHLRNDSFISLYYKHFLIYILPKLEYFIIKTNIFYTIFWIIPRLILLTALFIDVFIYNQFDYKYQVILFGLLLFFNRCFKYILKNMKEEQIKYLSLYIKVIGTDYVFGIHPSEWPENYDPDDEDNDDYSSSMCLPLDIFIKFQTESIVYENIKRSRSFSITQRAIEEFWEKYVEEKYVFYAKYFNRPVPSNYKNKFGDKPPGNYNKAFVLVHEKCDEYLGIECDKIMQISLMIEYLNKISNNDKKIKNMKILIYLNYLLCWLYVLIVSLPNLHIDELLIVLMRTCLMIKEPFSDLNINDT